MSHTSTFQCMLLRTCMLAWVLTLYFFFQWYGNQDSIGLCAYTVFRPPDMFKVYALVFKHQIKNIGLDDLYLWDIHFWYIVDIGLIGTFWILVWLVPCSHWLGWYLADIVLVGILLILTWLVPCWLLTWLVPCVCSWDRFALDRLHSPMTSSVGCGALWVSLYPAELWTCHMEMNGFVSGSSDPGQWRFQWALLFSLSTGYDYM